MLMWSKAKWPAESDVTAKVSLQYFVAIGRSRVVIRDGVDQGDRERRKSSPNNSPHSSVHCSQVDQSQHWIDWAENVFLLSRVSLLSPPFCLFASMAKQATNTITASWNWNLDLSVRCVLQLHVLVFISWKRASEKAKHLFDTLRRRRRNNLS